MADAPVITLLNGDSLTLLADPALRAMRPKPGMIFKADACVSDPPYGFDFDGTMCKGDWVEGQARVEGNDWDKFKDERSFATAADDSAQFALFTKRWSYLLKSEVLWEGAHLLAFSADRTIDLVGRGLREAGYDIVRILFWLYAQGQVKNPNDLRPGCEPIFCARVPTKQDLMKLHKRLGRGQLNAQVWKEEDGKHPTNILMDEGTVALDEDLQRQVAENRASFFIPKASPKDRDWGCEDLPVRQKSNRLSHMSSEVTGKVVKPVMAHNIHPTVKPIELMRRLIRLVSRPGHTIIDPFMGSGTTGVAAVLEGRNFIGIEREPEYFEIARTRIESALAEAAAAA